jgi:hypothetical protein
MAQRTPTNQDKESIITQKSRVKRAEQWRLKINSDFAENI